MNIQNQKITYCQLKDNNFSIENDRYGIASYILTKPRVNSILNCPSININDVVLFFTYADGTVVSRTQFFPTFFKSNDTIIKAQSGSALEVAEEYRHLGVGIDAMMYAATNKESDIFISSGISDMALPMLKKIKYYVLEFPRIMRICNVRPILEKIGIHGTILAIISKILNFILRIIFQLIRIKKSRLKGKTIKKETIIPVWVDQISLNDGHKYMEVHDRKWFQWNLDNNFRGLERDIQSFYSVWENNQPIGFFMTKERFRVNAGGLNNVRIGSIVEWGTSNSNLLNELDVYNMSIPTFSKDLDIIETATSNLDVVKRAKRLGFLKHGFAHILIKDKKKQYKDSKNIDLWRVRYGYADVILT